MMDQLTRSTEMEYDCPEYACLMANSTPPSPPPD
uniref:Uncharacterized protein n=1 Tax=Arundo donax TaxID=35708 RepID=A0A0A9ADD8_ARUDO